MTTRTTFAALAVAAALMLTGCSSAGVDGDSSDELAAGAPLAAPVDRTAEFAEANAAAPWAAQVTSVIETELNRLIILTTIVDPRVDDGSPEALTAIEICEAAVALVAAADGTYVSVAEADGTPFVLYGHPAAPDGECAEV